MPEPEEEEKPRPLPLTLESRRALALDLEMIPEASAMLQRDRFLEKGLAALVDGGHLDTAFRLLARMLSPAKAMLWAILCHDDANPILTEGELPADVTRRALLAFARAPGEATRDAAERAGQALGWTEPLGMAASALSVLPNGKAILLDGEMNPETKLFADLVGRSILLVALGTPGGELARATKAKVLAAKGVSLALYRKP